MWSFGYRCFGYGYGGSGAFGAFGGFQVFCGSWFYAILAADVFLAAMAAAGSAPLVLLEVLIFMHVFDGCAPSTSYALEM